MKKNGDKDKEQFMVEIKSISRKFETEKARADNLQSRVNEKELEITKSKEVLNQANK